MLSSKISYFLKLFFEDKKKFKEIFISILKDEDETLQRIYILNFIKKLSKKEEKEEFENLLISLKDYIKKNEKIFEILIKKKYYNFSLILLKEYIKENKINLKNNKFLKIILKYTNLSFYKKIKKERIIDKIDNLTKETKIIIVLTNTNFSFVKSYLKDENLLNLKYIINYYFFIKNLNLKNLIFFLENAKNKELLNNDFLFKNLENLTAKNYKEKTDLNKLYLTIMHMNKINEKNISKIYKEIFFSYKNINKNFNNHLEYKKIILELIKKAEKNIYCFQDDIKNKLFYIINKLYYKKFFLPEDIFILIENKILRNKKDLELEKFYINAIFENLKKMINKKDYNNIKIYSNYLKTYEII